VGVKLVWVEGEVEVKVKKTGTKELERVKDEG